MTISKELFLALLSMDAYNRGYGAGISDGLGETDADGKDIDGLGRIASKIGVATVVNDANKAQDAGFYALAYTVGAGVAGIAPGTTIISYRGTDSFLNNDISGGSDPINGWVTGGGAWQTDQVRFPQEFFQAATDTQGQDARAGTAILTGHSLGGGLAGFVGAPKGIGSAPLRERQAA